jgi:hypothetical protein
MPLMASSRESLLLSGNLDSVSPSRIHIASNVLALEAFFYSSCQICDLMPYINGREATDDYLTLSIDEMEE